MPTPAAPDTTLPNPEAALARDFVNQTDRHIFLTGRAGTGKTTFLHRLRETTAKQHAIVAPTGVAAINARGVTIHSFFQLPFGNLTPERLRTEMGKKRLRKDKVRVLRGLDLLVIDEVSMVRADVLDGIDYVLRRYRRNNRPFGGVQLLLIGDLHQLPPVVRNEDWEELSRHYRSSFFFGSRALQKSGLLTIELKHIYRQSDRTFIELLNRVRRNEMTDAVLRQLNDRYRFDYQPPVGDGTITLTSHRHTADRTNAQRLAELSGELHTYTALIKGKFPPSMYPTEEKLELKVGAQVMFIKNDPDKRYYNGKIGEVTKLGEELVTVRCPDGRVIETGALEWVNQKYALDEASKELREETEGSFKQIPLRLAWAVTIHKSQGLTFDRVVIDAAAAFAHGQVYVALSRCRTLEGIVLNSRIAPSSVRTDESVDRYTQRARETAPDETSLAAARLEYRRSLVRDLFDFGAIRQALQQLHRYVLEKETAYVSSPLATTEALVAAADQLDGMARKFGAPLTAYLDAYDWTQPGVQLDERPRKAIDYFGHQMVSRLTEPLAAVDWRTDNQTVQGRTEERLEPLQVALRVKRALLKLAQGRFTAQDYLRTRTRAELGSAPGGGGSLKERHARKRAQAVRAHPHPGCLAELSKWRDALAMEHGKRPHQILPTRALDGIAATLPRNRKELLKVQQFGAERARLYGPKLLGIVSAYCKTKKIDAATRAAAQAAAPPPRKTDTVNATLSLYALGKSIGEIAAARGLNESTVLGHLVPSIVSGKISVREFVKAAEQAEIEAYLTAHPDESLGEIRAGLDNRYNYGQLRVIQELLARR